MQPASVQGERFVALCEEHASTFATEGARFDAPATFPLEFVDAMRESGLLGAMAPEEYGGFGVALVQDLVAGMNRLGRGDGGITIGLCMHFLGTFMMARRWRNDPDSVSVANLEAVARGDMVMAVLNSEPGSDNRHPFAEATPAERDGVEGYLLNGRKSFATFSPAANLFSARVRIALDESEWGMASATIPADAPGVEPQDNWDALGMRDSGSQDVVLNNVFIPKRALTPPTPWGRLGAPGHMGGVVTALSLAAPFLGIAEAAHAATIDMVGKRTKQPGATPLREWQPVQQSIAENEMDLVAMRGVLERAARLVDATFAAAVPGEPGLPVLQGVMKETQAAKYVVNHTAVKLVDRCLAISGGSGYHTRSPLSKLYRDVRAGSFMSPFGALEAPEYIGRYALGLPPEG